MQGTQNQQIIKKLPCKLGLQGYTPIDQQAKLEGVQKLKFISYNVWFDQLNFVDRNQELRNLFKKYDPDFICLQEVTPYFIQLAIQDQELCSKYYFSSPSVNNYDVLILSKYPMTFYTKPYQSNQGRNFLFGSINVNQVELAFGTTHLESMPQNMQYRKAQLQIIQQQLDQYPESIFMGDLNLEYKDEGQNLPKSYTDIWQQLNPNDLGITFPQNGKRLDRVLLKQSKNWQATKIEIIGKDNLPLYSKQQPASKYEVTTPSDHYGLYAEITFIGKK